MENKRIQALYVCNILNFWNVSIKSYFYSALKIINYKYLGATHNIKQDNKSFLKDKEFGSVDFIFQLYI